MRLVVPGLLVVLILASGACGSSSPSPTTLAPTASPTPSPAPTPTSVPLSEVTRQRLPGMVLGRVDAELPGLTIASRSGYLSSADVASHTLNPRDTSEDINGLGFLDGYQHQFSNPTDALQVVASFRVYRWRTPGLVRDFIQSQLDDSRGSGGREFSGGVAVTRFEEAQAPDVGENSVAFRLTGRAAAALNCS